MPLQLRKSHPGYRVLGSRTCKRSGVPDGSVSISWPARFLSIAASLRPSPARGSNLGAVPLSRARPTRLSQLELYIRSPSETPTPALEQLPRLPPAGWFRSRGLETPSPSPAPPPAQLLRSSAGKFGTWCRFPLHYPPKYNRRSASRCHIPLKDLVRCLSPALWW